jgi:hypothetical protein
LCSTLFPAACPNSRERNVHRLRRWTGMFHAELGRTSWRCVRVFATMAKRSQRVRTNARYCVLLRSSVRIANYPSLPEFPYPYPSGYPQFHPSASPLRLLGCSGRCGTIRAVQDVVDHYVSLQGREIGECIRPPPCRRMRPGASEVGSFNSAIPCRMTGREIPVALETEEIPPRPAAWLSAAATKRCARRPEPASRRRPSVPKASRPLA